MAPMKHTGFRKSADGTEWETKRDAAGREWEFNPKTGLPNMTPDSAAVQRQKAAKPKQVLTPGQTEALQEVQDAKDREKIKAMGYAHGGKVFKGFGKAKHV